MKSLSFLEKRCSLAVVVATAEEGAPLIASLGNMCDLKPRLGRAVIGDFGGRRWVVAETGIGAKRARDALEVLFELLPVERLLLAGVCGGVAPQLQTSQSFFPQRVQDVRGDFWLEGDQAAWAWAEEALRGTLKEGVLVSAESLIGRLEKQRLREKFPEVQAVDLEALEFAKVATQHGIAWAVLKTVADPFDFDLPAEAGLLKRLPSFTEAVKSAIRENARLVRELMILCPTEIGR